jgi:3-deoxy-D-manno-octulosonic-acid transferase
LLAWRHSLAAVTAALALPVGLVALALRPSWRAGWRERLGVAGLRAPGAIWVHAASVGEITAAARLIDRLLETGYPVVVSTTTSTGLDVMRRARPDVPCQLAPLDHPWCVDAALSRVAPAALVMIETELWPCWIAAAARRDIPLVLVSGRVSDRSFPRYQKLGLLFRSALRRFDAIGARTSLDRDRFVALGADPDVVHVSGDLKLDVDSAPHAASADLVEAIGEGRLFVAGSTHDGEESAALEALDVLEKADVEATLVLAPRHLDRVNEVEQAVRGAGRECRRRTALGGSRLRAGEVLIIDTLGELASLYAHATAAFVGGTLVDVGGHNIVEPVLARCPVLYGPHTQNVSHAAEILEGSGAGERLRDARELGPAVLQLIRDPARARARGEAGWEVLQRHRGSTENAAELVTRAISEHTASECGP